jgi:transposase
MILYTFLQRACYNAVANKKGRTVDKLIINTFNSTAMKSMSKSTLLVSTDGSKDSHWVYLKQWKGEGWKPFSITNDRDGFEKISEKIEVFKKQRRLKDIAFAYESTGSYLQPLVRYMKEKGANLIQVNPKHVKRLKELPDNSPGKTDRKDPRVIALVVEGNAGMSAILPTGEYAELRQFTQGREQLMDDRTRCLNRMEALVAEYFPEYLKIMNGLQGETSRYLLRHYGTPVKILELGKEKLTQEMRQVSRSRLKEDRAELLYRAAQNSIGVTEGVSGMESRIHLLLNQFDLITSQLKEVTEKIIAICQGIPYTKYIVSIKGMGWMTTAYLVGEVSDMQNYSRAKQIEKLAGLNLFEISSGMRKGQKRITKRGRELLRKILYLASLRMVSKNGIFHHEYQNLLKRGKNKHLALVNISKKILRLAFAVVRDQVYYNPDYQKNLKTAV